MPHYNPPLRDMQFVLHELIGVVDRLKTLPRHADVDAATIDAVVEEGGKFAAEVLAPLNQRGDEQGCVLDPATHEVKAPDGFKDAYAKFVEGGWPALIRNTRNIGDFRKWKQHDPYQKAFERLLRDLKAEEARG